MAAENSEEKIIAPESTLSANIKIPPERGGKVIKAIAGIDEPSPSADAKKVPFTAAIKRPNVSLVIKRRSPTYVKTIRNGKRQTVDISSQATEEEGPITKLQELKKLISERFGGGDFLVKVVDNDSGDVIASETVNIKGQPKIEPSVPEAVSMDDEDGGTENKKDDIDVDDLLSDPIPRYSRPYSSSYYSPYNGGTPSRDIIELKTKMQQLEKENERLRKENEEIQRKKEEEERLRMVIEPLKQQVDSLNKQLAEKQQKEAVPDAITLRIEALQKQIADAQNQKEMFEKLIKPFQAQIEDLKTQLEKKSAKEVSPELEELRKQNEQLQRKLEEFNRDEKVRKQWEEQIKQQKEDYEKRLIEMQNLQKEQLNELKAQLGSIKTSQPPQPSDNGQNAIITALQNQINSLMTMMTSMVNKAGGDKDTVEQMRNLMSLLTEFNDMLGGGIGEPKDPWMTIMDKASGLVGELVKAKQAQGETITKEEVQKIIEQTANEYFQKGVKQGSEYTLNSLRQKAQQRMMQKQQPVKTLNPVQPQPPVQPLPTVPVVDLSKISSRDRIITQGLLYDMIDAVKSNQIDTFSKTAYAKLPESIISALAKANTDTDVYRVFQPYLTIDLETALKDLTKDEAKKQQIRTIVENIKTWYSTEINQKKTQTETAK